MKTVYANQFDICSPNVDTRVTMAEIESLISSWVMRKYQRTWNTLLNLEFGTQNLSPLPNHVITMTVQETDEFRYSQFEWSHPDDQEKNLLWKTFITLCTDSNKIEFSIVLRIESAQFIVKPVLGYNFGRPGVVDEILEKYECKISGEIIPKQTQKITNSDEVEDFVSNILESPKRVLPVVLLSKDVWTDTPFTDPENVQRKVLGYARVVVIDKYAGFELTGLVGKQLSCYNGAIRVYWAGFNKASDPYSHQLYLQDKMLAYKSQGSYIETYLFRLFANVASLRYSEGELAKQAILALQKKRSDETAKIRAELHENRLSVAEIEQELLKSWEEIEQLRREVSDSKVRIQELESEIVNHRENYRNLIELQEKASLDAPEKVEPLEFDNVLTAVTEADRLFVDKLSIWDSAVDSAGKSNFSRPKEVFEALKAVAELGDVYFSSKKSGESMGSWEQFFAAKGFKYAPTDSEMTINLYGNERIFTHQGTRKQMLKHITIGGGDRTNCIQIYFEPNDSSETIEVGYCGVHLKYYNQRT